MGGRHNKGDETWHQRSAVIFCMLHPKAWGSLPLKDSTKEACKLIGYRDKTIYNWFALPRPGKKRTLKTCMVKNWWYITNSMTWADVKAQFIDGSLDDFGWEIEDPDDVQQELEKYADYRGAIPVLSKFDCTISAAAKGRLAARGSHVVQKVKTRDTAHKQRRLRYPTVETLLHRIVRERWHMGDAMSRLEINDELCIAFSENYKETEDGDKFFKGHINPDYRGQTAKLAKFVSAALSRMKPPYSVPAKAAGTSTL